MSGSAAGRDWMIRAALLPAWLGLAAMGWTWLGMDSHRDGIIFAIAAWMTALDLCLVGGVLYRQATGEVSADEQQRCSDCGYDRSGTTGACPECGSAQPPRPRPRAGWKGLLLVGFGLLVGLIALTLGSLFAWPAVWHV